jgi:hypothetical protein
MSSFDEGQQIWIDAFGVGREHTVREAGIELQGRVLEELDLQLGGTLVWNDLIVVPLHAQGRHVDALQVVGEIRLGPGTV